MKKQPPIITVSMRLPTALVKKLDEEAQKNTRNRSQMTKVILEEHFEK